MDLSRQDYPGMLAHLQPAQAVKVLDDRVRYINRVNVDIADWLQERRRIEEVYAQSLRKLAVRQFADIQVSDLGVFATPWQKIVASTNALAQAHHTLAQNVYADVENPIREFASGNSEMLAMANIIGNLRAIAKEADNANKKAEKLREKGGKAAAGKVALAATEVENAHGQWESQAPYVFERLQAVDEARVDHQRNGLTQFQTHVIECFSATGSSAEECLNALLNVQTADEITTFALKTTRSLPTITTTPSNTTVSERRKSTVQESVPPPTTDAGSSLAPVPSLPRTDEMASNRSGSIPEKEKEKEKSKGFGLKSRLGTVIGRRRQSTHPYQQGISPERKKSSSNIGSAFGRFRQSHQQFDSHLSPPQTARTTSDVPSENLPASNADSSTVLERFPSSDRTNGTTLESVRESNGGPSIVNGTQGNHAFEPITTRIPSSTIEPSKDAEGFSVPSSTIDPIQQAMNEAAQANEAAAQFKVNIKNAPIVEESGDASAAMADVANALQAQATPQRALTTRSRRNRNTILITDNPSIPEVPRDTSPPRASMPPPASSFPAVVFPPVPFPAAPTPPPVSSSDTPPMQQIPSPQATQSPFSLTHRNTLGIGDNAGSDTHSIRSGRSLNSLLSVKHPDFHEPGLNCSIVETINAEFSQGSVTRAVMTGELALAYNPPDLNGPFGTETILLDNFSSLEKVAPNPAFIEPVTTKPGQFTVDLSHVTKTSIAFKYQVNLVEGSYSSHVPLLLTSAFKVEPTQTSVKVHYSLNPTFTQALPASSFPFTLSGVVIVLHLDPTGARTKSVLIKPTEGSSFRKAENLVYWRLGDVTFTKDAAPQMLLARFQTEGEAKPGNVEARWEIHSEHVPNLGSGLGVSKLDTSAAKEEDEEEEVEADPFADEEAAATAAAAEKETWTAINKVKRWRAGSSYLALPAANS